MATRLTYFPELLVGIRKPSTDAMLNAGTVTFYEAGTTTLKSVYNDVGGTSAADNPKTLDAYGSARVYGEGIYKLVIKDSAGNTVWTWDNYKLRYYNVSVTSKSANYQATIQDDLILVNTSGGGVTITLPQASTASIPLYIKKTSSDANSVTVAAYAGDLVDGAASTTFSAQNYTAVYFSNGSTAWYGSADTTNATQLNGYTASQTPTASTIVVAQSGSTFIHDDWIDWGTKAGAGIAFTASDPTSGVLSADTDGTTLELSAATAAGVIRIKDSGVSTAKIADNAITAAKIEDYVASSTGYMTNTTPGDGSSQSTSYVKVSEYKCPVAGTLWSSFGLYVNGDMGYGRIYVNGSAVGTEHSTTSGTAVQKTDASITVAAGDLIQLYVKISNAASTVWATSWCLRTSAGYIAPLNYNGSY